MSNGVKLLTQITTLAKERPVVAVFLALIFLAMLNGGISFALDSLGPRSGATNGLTEKLNKLVNDHTYIKSAIKQESKDRIREITQLKKDGKLLSEASIRLIIIEEFGKMEDRLVERLK